MKTDKKNSKSLKIAIIGYGVMGKHVEKVCADRGHEVTKVFDIDSRMTAGEYYDFDVAIDFSYPEAVPENVKTASKLKKNIVIGTTGWEKDFAKVKSIASKSGIGVVFGSNYSVGMQMFFRIAEFAAKLKNHQNEYDIFIHEIHHKRKKDSPSGTALSLAEIILNKVDSKKLIKTDKSTEAITSKELHVSSTRGGDIPGTHTIYIDSPADTIELTHRARNREGFAVGAVIAAEWLFNKTGFYDFRDVVGNIWDL